MQRLKDARAEAQKEIEQLKQQKIAEYKEYERSVLGSLDVAMQEYAVETEEKVRQVQRVGQEKEGEIVEMLIEFVTKVEPKVHQNISSK